ncbi:MAG: hypothetical protein LBI87_08400 [Candidatus Accumulibacter sp.]|nr:hypothetical protein [Accumulibacter sp.]
MRKAIDHGEHGEKQNPCFSPCVPYYSWLKTFSATEKILSKAINHGEHSGHGENPLKMFLFSGMAGIFRRSIQKRHDSIQSPSRRPADKGATDFPPPFVAPVVVNAFCISPWIKNLAYRQN